MSFPDISRRAFGRLVAGATAACSWPPSRAAKSDGFQLRYTLASAMYGTLPLSKILPEVARTGSAGIDLWPKPHGSQREELKAMGVEKFTHLIHEHGVKVEALTRFDLGPFRLAGELAIAQALGASVIVCGGSGPRGLLGEDLKRAIRDFVETMKPHVALAEARGVRIAIENHRNAMIQSPDSLRWLAESIASPNLGIALAPFHLPQDAALLEQLIGDVGPQLLFFYAWQPDMGSAKNQPKEEQLRQMPGRGELDFAPLLRALKKTNFAGLTEIFMHPTPRGIPIRETAAEVTAEINRARGYLAERLATL